MLNIAGLKVTNQTFGRASSESQDFEGFPDSGIIGFGFGSIAASGQPTVFENLMANGQVLVPFFSVHLTRGAKGGSEVRFAGDDAQHGTGTDEWCLWCLSSIHVIGLSWLL